MDLVRERWRLMEQFESIAKSEPVFAGDLISKPDEKRLREGDLVRRRRTDGKCVLTLRGRILWYMWRRLA